MGVICAPSPPVVRCAGVIANSQQHKRPRVDRLPALHRVSVRREQIGQQAHLEPLRSKDRSTGRESSSSHPNVDPDLWEVLDLADNEELEELHSILFGERRRSCRLTFYKAFACVWHRRINSVSAI